MLLDSIAHHGMNFIYTFVWFIVIGKGNVKEGISTVFNQLTQGLKIKEKML